MGARRLIAVAVCAVLGGAAFHVALWQHTRVTDDRPYAKRALAVALDMRQHGALATTDTWIIEDLQKLSE